MSFIIHSQKTLYYIITYKQQFDKLTEAYINNLVNPLDNCACFVGNLLNRASEWACGRRSFGVEQPSKKAFNCILREAEGFYTMQEILDLENCFLRSIDSYRRHGNKPLGLTSVKISVNIEHLTPLTEFQEEALFYGFSETLDMLKEIHISKGEIIDDAPIFTKRQLITA